jgi:hypothetical protein
MLPGAFVSSHTSYTVRFSSLDWRHFLFFPFFLFLLVGIFQMPVEIAPQFSHKRAHGAGKGLRFRAVDVYFVASQATLLRGL